MLIWLVRGFFGLWGFFLLFWNACSFITTFIWLETGFSIQYPNSGSFAQARVPQRRMRHLLILAKPSQKMTSKLHAPVSTMGKRPCRFIADPCLAVKSFCLNFVCFPRIHPSKHTGEAGRSRRALYIHALLSWWKLTLCSRKMNLAHQKDGCISCLLISPPVCSAQHKSWLTYHNYIWCAVYTGRVNADEPPRDTSSHYTELKASRFTAPAPRAKAWPGCSATQSNSTTSCLTRARIIV